MQYIKNDIFTLDNDLLFLKLHKSYLVTNESSNIIASNLQIEIWIL
jgi:hypothetical protein